MIAKCYEMCYRTKFVVHCYSLHLSEYMKYFYEKFNLKQYLLQVSVDEPRVNKSFIKQKEIRE